MVQLVLLIKLPSFKNCNMFKFAFINFNYNFICILKQNIHIYVAYGWNYWAEIFCGHSIFFNPNFFQNIVFLQFFFPRATPGPSASPKFKKMEKQGKNDKSTLVFASFSDRFLNISSARVKIGHSKWKTNF